MRALIIGGTGTISMSISKLLIAKGWELYLVNRGIRASSVEGAHMVSADLNDETAFCETVSKLGDFDVVADFFAFHTDAVERDIRCFNGKTKQYIFISSASAYQKPLSSPYITESTPLHNPYWQYSRDKIACERVLMNAYTETGFPITIVRPSHTYADGAIPLSFHSDKGPWTELKRMMNNKEVIVHGDGTSLWTVTHSTDFAKGFVGLMGNIHAIGEAVHITSDESLTWDQIYTSVGNALGVTPKLIHISSEMLIAREPSLLGPLLGDKSNTVIFDNSKLKRLVPDFCATTRFDQGIRQSMDCLLANPALQVFDPEWDAWIDETIRSVRA